MEKEYINIGKLILLFIAALWGYYRLWREGILRPRIEFEIECEFLGIENNQVLAQFILKAKNKGLVRYKFRKIELQVRGIRKDQKLEFWEGMNNRLNFPESIIKANVIPKEYNFYFVEPNVQQAMNYITKINRDIEYIVVNAKFRYDRFTPHSIEKAFKVKVNA